MKTNTYERLIKEMPVGLERAILRVLSSHDSRNRPIGRKDLVVAVHQLGARVHERQLREKIKELRRQGHLICSAPGEDGGYFLASSWQEYHDFKQTEYLAKILDMQKTLNAMDRSADQTFGDSPQLALF